MHYSTNCISHSNIEAKNCEMRTLIFPILGGRGNRYFQLNAALNIASSLDYKRILCLVRRNEQFSFEDLDIQMNSPLISKIDFKYLRIDGFCGRAVWKLIHLQIRLSSETGRIFRQIKRASGFFLSALLTSRMRSIVKVVTSDNTGFFEIPRTRASILCIGYFQSLNYGNVVKYLYKKSDEVNLEQRLDNSKRVLIHLRRGDYHLSHELGILKASYYAKIVNKLLTENECLQFSVFSDEVLEEKLVKTIFGSDLTKLNISLFFANSFSESESFALMSKEFDYYVIANSSFSYWASVIGQTDESKVYCPYPWFNTAPTPRGIYNEGWIRCRSEFKELELDGE